jgi:nucleoside 2-deoxyribosyltransferase
MDSIKEKKVYIAGPMRGFEDFNYKAFNDAAWDLHEKGYTVISPVTIDIEEGITKGEMEDRTTQEWMKRDLPMMLECDAVVTLPKWAFSEGAMIECQVAMLVGMPIYQYPNGEIIYHPERDPKPWEIIHDAT